MKYSQVKKIVHHYSIAKSSTGVVSSCFQILSLWYYTSWLSSDPFASLPPILYLLIILSQVGQAENYSPQTEAALDSAGDDTTTQRTATAVEVLRRNIPSSRTRVKRNSKCKTEDVSHSDNDSQHERKEHHGESYHSITGVKQALELSLTFCFALYFYACGRVPLKKTPSSESVVKEI